MTSEATGHLVAHHGSRVSHANHTVTGCLTSQVILGQYTLLTNTVRNEDLQKVVGHLIELVNLFNVSAHYGLFFFEDADCAVDLHIHFVPEQETQN